MTYGFEVSDGIGSLTGTSTRTVRFVASGVIANNSTASFNVSLAGIDYEEAFLYFEPLADNSTSYQDNNSFAPDYSISGTIMTITAREVGGTYFVGVT